MGISKEEQIEQIEQLKQAIADLEAQLSILGDEVVEVQLTPARQKMGSPASSHTQYSAVCPATDM